VLRDPPAEEDRKIAEDLQAKIDHLAASHKAAGEVDDDGDKGKADKTMVEDVDEEMIEAVDEHIATQTEEAVHVEVDEEVANDVKEEMAKEIDGNIAMETENEAEKDFTTQAKEVVENVR
jgi:hypothetical protein